MTIMEIETIICKERGVDPEILHIEGRQITEFVLTRQIIMYFSFMYRCGTQFSIGAFFGRDHATALHAKKVINNLIETDKRFAQQIRDYKIQIDISIGFVSIPDLKHEIITVENRLGRLKFLLAELETFTA